MKCRLASLILFAVFAAASTGAFVTEARSQEVVGMLDVEMKCLSYLTTKKQLSLRGQKVKLIAVMEERLIELWTDRADDNWSLVFRQRLHRDRELGCLAAWGQGMAETRQFIEKGLAQ